MSTPHLYYFNPNSYGQEWFVVAYSRDEAIAAVRAHVLAEHDKERFEDDDPSWREPPFLTAAERREESRQRVLANLDLYINETKGQWDRDDEVARIEEYPIGHVIQTEIS